MTFEFVLFVNLVCNLVSLCMRIINSVVMVGLYYGVLTTLSMVGPSYLFYLRMRVLEKGSKKEVSAISGFIMGQLIMFISIYYEPLYITLSRPHTLTFLGVPYLCFYFFRNNRDDFSDYGSFTRNSMRNLSIQCEYLNNVIFQLLNHLFFPSTIFFRLVNIYMFRCNNKMLFITSSFIGWLIGHILFIKWGGLLVTLIQKKNYIRSNVFIRANKYFVKYLVFVAEFRTFINKIFRYIGDRYNVLSQSNLIRSNTHLVFVFNFVSECVTDVIYFILPMFRYTRLVRSDLYQSNIYLRADLRNSVEQLFHILFFVTGLCWVTMMPSPILTPYFVKEFKSIKRTQSEKEFIEDDPFYKTLDEKPVVTILFDYNRWCRPLRYIANDQFQNAVRNEMSQYFFYTCRSDGQERISFNYPPSLSTFLEMVRRKMSMFTTEKVFYGELDNHWNYNNEQKKKNLSNEFRNRIKALDKKSLSSNILEKRIRLCNDETKKEYLPKIYDPLLSGPYRGRIKNSIITETCIKNYIEIILINKIHLFLIIPNYRNFEPKITTFNEFVKKPTLSFNLKELSDHKEEKMDLKDQRKNLKNLFDATLGDPNNKKIRKKSTGLQEISKKVPKWAYKLIDESTGDDRDNFMFKKFEHVFCYFSPTNTTEKNDRNNPIESIYRENTNEGELKGVQEMTAIRYLRNPDFGRKTIISTMPLQRRKIIPGGFVQVRTYSYFFFWKKKSKLVKKLTNLFSNFEPLRILFINWIYKKTGFALSDSIYKTIQEKKAKKERKKKTREKFFHDIGIETIEDYLDREQFEHDPDREKIFNALDRKKIIHDLNSEEEEEEEEDDSAYEEKIFFESLEAKYIPDYADAEEKDEEDAKQLFLDLMETFNSFIYFAPELRSCLLLVQSYFRRKILLPFLIILKNTIRILLFQSPEWSEDFSDLNNEIHINCTFAGVPLSETQLPANWLTDGFQIKIIFPFRLKPWHRSKPKFPHKDSKKKRMKKGKKRKGQKNYLKNKTDFKNHFCFLTSFGLESERPFCSSRVGFYVFDPIFEELANQMRKLKKKCFLVLKKMINKLSKSKKKPIREVEVYELNETKKEKDSISNNQTIQKMSIPIPSMDWTNSLLTEKEKRIRELNLETIQKKHIPISYMDWTNFSLPETEKRIQELTFKTNEILNQIEKIKKVTNEEKERKKNFRTSEINISTNKIDSNAKRFKSLKNFSLNSLKEFLLKSLKNFSLKNNVILIRKLLCFIKIIKIWIEKRYIKILKFLLGSINILRIDAYPFLGINAYPFLESKRKIFKKSIWNNFNKYIWNNEERKKEISKTNRNKEKFISIIKKKKKLLSIKNINNINSQIFCDVSPFLSQAYVFYKLSQIHVINLYKLRSALQYHGASLFLKNEIKDYFKDFFGGRGLFHYELKDKKVRNSVTNQWKNWLKSHYQYNYNLSPIRWSRLMSQKWRNRINQHYMVQKKDLNKLNLYEKQKDFEVDPLPRQKDNLKKNYRYNLLSYKSIYCEGKKDSNIYVASLTKKNQPEIVSNYKTDKKHFLDTEDNIFDILNSNIFYILDRKYLDSDRRFYDFCVGATMNFKATMHKEDPFFLTFHQDELTFHQDELTFHQDELTFHQDELTFHQDQEVNSSKKKLLFDWMGMNEEMLNFYWFDLKLKSNSNLSSWFFPKFVKLYNEYKKNPWVIPIRFLLLNWNRNENENVKANQEENVKANQEENVKANQEENVKENQKANVKENQKENVKENQKENVKENRENTVKKDYAKFGLVPTGRKKTGNKFKNANFTRSHFGFYRQRYSYVQFRWQVFVNKRRIRKRIANTVNSLYLLSKVGGNAEAWSLYLSFCRRKELNSKFPIMGNDFHPKKKKHRFYLLRAIPFPSLVENVNDGQFIMYQSISVFLVHKNKRNEQINQRNREKDYLDKTYWIQSLGKLLQNIVGKRKKFLLVPENILSPKRRKELRILISFNLKNRNDIHINTENFNGNKIKNFDHFLNKSSKDFDRNKLIKFKTFLWPNYRFEDLACMNRYWFNTNNGSRFSMLRIHIYPRLKSSKGLNFHIFDLFDSVVSVVDSIVNLLA